MCVCPTQLDNEKSGHNFMHESSPSPYGVRWVLDSQDSAEDGGQSKCSESSALCFAVSHL